MPGLKLKSLKFLPLLYAVILTGCGNHSEIPETGEIPIISETDQKPDSADAESGTAVPVDKKFTQISKNTEKTQDTTTQSAISVDFTDPETSESSDYSGTSTDVATDEDDTPQTWIFTRTNSGNSSHNSKTTTKNTIKTTSTQVTSNPTTVTETVTEIIPDPPESPEPDPVTEPETDPEPEVIYKSGSVWEIMDQMTIREKIYQLFVVTPEQITDSSLVTAAGEKTQNAIHSQPVGGLIYFADNLVNSSQVSTMLSNSQQYARESGIGLFLAVDEEGGLVARCAKKLGTTKLSPMATYGTRNDFNEAFSVGQTLGNDISQFGFNLDFAPVADVNLNSGNELGNRIFSDDPEVTAYMVSGVVQGLQSTGVAATLKHFPGLGAENGNAHYDDAVHIDRSLDQLRAEEFIPFRSGIDAGSDFVMVSHQIVSGVGDGLPSCLSYTVCTDLLRNELGFDGIIITDSFQMNTISGSYSPADSAILAIDAGVDIILMPSDLQAAVNALEDAVNTGRISEERINQSVERILLEKEKLNILG